MFSKKSLVAEASKCVYKWENVKLPTNLPFLNYKGGTEVERRPLVPKVPGSNPMMSGFCLWDFSTGYVSRKQTSSVINISLKLVLQSM